MKVIFGLGNPDKQYAGTRHNIGFWVLDALAAEWGTNFKKERKFKAEVAEVTIDDEKVLLVKPATYYNAVGESARAILDFYKLTVGNILVAHDDLALPLGTIRTRLGGSSGGNNGLKSLEAHLGPASARLRVGVWTEQHHGAEKVGVVLGKLSKSEQSLLGKQLPTIVSLVTQFASNTYEPVTFRTEN